MAASKKTSSSSSSEKSIDMFISYEQKLESIALSLYDEFMKYYEVRLYMDSIKLKNCQRFYRKAGIAIIKSKMIVCIVNKDYFNTQKTKNELILGYMTQKPTLILIFELLSSSDFEDMTFALQESTRFQVTDGNNEIFQWDQSKFYQIVALIQDLMKRKLTKKVQQVQDAAAQLSVVLNESNEKYNKFCKIEEPAKEKISHEKLEKKEITAEEHNKIIDKAIIPDPKHNNLRRMRYTSLFEFICGYNRMVYIKSKERFLITSSYNHSIVSIDQYGIWIERRNPYGKLGQPWGICVNEMTNEVFIGDNEFRCIFVFDICLKYLRKFGEHIAIAFTDMFIDIETNTLYAVNVFDSALLVIDLKKEKLLSSIFINAPIFVRVHKEKVYIAATDDVIYILTKEKLDLEKKIEFEGSRFLSSLTVLSESCLFTSCFRLYKNNDKAKEKHLAIIKIRDDELTIKYINLKIGYINDMVMLKDHLVCISDTHIFIYSYHDIQNF